MDELLQLLSNQPIQMGQFYKRPDDLGLKRTGNYSLDIDGLRVPTLVPGNEQLAGDIRLGNIRRPTQDEAVRGLLYALANPSEAKPADSPMSPFGSAFDLPARNFNVHNMYDITHQIYGVNPLLAAIMFPGFRPYTLR